MEGGEGAMTRPAKRRVMNTIVRKNVTLEGMAMVLSECLTVGEMEGRSLIVTTVEAIASVDERRREQKLWR